MEDNYLWDRSGEADPEIQELEEILGTLRYQPRPLQIPANFPIAQRRDYRSWLAVAAALALVAIGLGLWFSFNRRQVEVASSNNSQPAPRRSDSPAPLPTAPEPVRSTAEADTQETPPRRRETPRNLTARNINRNSKSTTRQPELTPQELAEKEQVLVALRLISFKLNLAQRKAQGAPALGPIRNQHRMDRIG